MFERYLIVFRYIHTIELQIEVTKHLNHYSENIKIFSPKKASPPAAASASSSTRSLGGAKASAKTQPPQSATLFGSTRMKVDVTSLVCDQFEIDFRNVNNIVNILNLLL